MKSKDCIGIIASPPIDDPATNQEPRSQERAARRLHEALVTLAKQEALEYEFELLSFVLPGASNTATQEHEKKIAVGGGSFLSLSAGFEEWLRTEDVEIAGTKPGTGHVDRAQRYRTLIAGTLETAELALRLRRSGIATRVVYVANHLLTPLRHWGVPVCDEDIRSEGQCLRRVNAVVFPSRAQREHYFTYYAPAPDVWTELITHGFSPLDGEAESDSQLPSQLEGTDIIFMASPPHAQSDYHTALYALRRIKAAHSRPVALVIAGAPPWTSIEPQGELRHMLETASELDLLGQLHLLGERTPAQMRAHYAKAKVTLLTSVNEAFGDVVAESLYVGTRVVATETGAIPQMVNSKKQGYVVPPRSPWAVAERVLDVLKSKKPTPEEVREPVAKLTWKSAARKYIQLLTRVQEPGYIRWTSQRKASNVVRELLRQRLQDKNWSIRRLTEEVNKSFESVRRVFDQDAAPNLRWSTVEPIARELCEPEEREKLRRMLTGEIQG